MSVNEFDSYTGIRALHTGMGLKNAAARCIVAKTGFRSFIRSFK